MSEFDLFADEFLEEQVPRNIIIVGSAKIDNLLRVILVKILRPKSAKEKDPDELLDPDNPLSTFSSRIKMVYRLGLIDKNFFCVLNQIRKIRNLSAHEINFYINKPPLSDSIRNLRNQISEKKSYLLIHDLYFKDEKLGKLDEIKCLFLTVCIILSTISDQCVQLSEDEVTLKTSSI
jgi:DNA-binding MltR family transcriptional regulator